MTFDLGRTLSRSFRISWRHRWLWLLGVFGGAGGGINYRFNNSTGNGAGGEQVGRFIVDHLALILAAVAVLLVIAVVAFVISCIAVPASIWAGLQLDVGNEIGLRAAWRAGRARGWRYFRLVLLKSLIGFAILLVFFLFVLLGIGLYAAGGNGTIPILILGGILAILVLIVALVLFSYGTLWADRMLVILDVGAADALRGGWLLVRQEKLNSFIFSLAFGVIKLVIGIGVFLVGLVVAVPGIVLAILYFTSHAPLALGIIGILWIVVLGFGAILVGSGYVGALNQVGYAIAARDLAIGKRMPVSPAVIGWDPYMPVPVPAT